MSKYELTDETKEVDGHILHRIRAVRHVGELVGEGDLGGWIESEKNLSHEGECWVSGGACVYDHAEVRGNAKVYGYARVHGYARVDGGAQVYDYAKVYGYARVHGEAKVCGYARVNGGAQVCDYAKVHGEAEVCGDALVHGEAEVCGDALVAKVSDCMVFENTWSSMRWFTYTRSNRMWKVGCFYGSGDELIEKAYDDGDVKGKCYEATVRYVEQIEAAMAEERKEEP